MSGNIKAKTITFKCENKPKQNIETELTKAGVYIGDTGFCITTKGRDLQIPASDVKKARAIIKKAGCKVVSVKKDIDILI